MELLKVFVGDGTTTAATLATMTPGDLLILDATSYAPLTSATIGTTRDIVIAGCILKNNVNTPVFSTPIKKANVKHVNATQGVLTAQKKLTATLTEVNLPINTTYSLGVQIKEDLRMGTYNKNTEIIVSATTPSTAYASSDDAMKDITSILAKSFTANPLSSAGSPSQLVNVTRAFTGTPTAVGGSVGSPAVDGTYVVVKGARQVELAGTVASAPSTIGGFLNIQGATYIVEDWDATNKIITLDTGYQGASGTFNSKTTMFKQVDITAWTFVFEGVAQSRNRYSQNRVVDFIVIYPKGFSDSGISVALTTPLKQGIGTYAQVKDLEEKAYTNITPLINYREFPFEDFALNANPSTAGYSLLTISYLAGWGYNMMQSNSAEFLQTVIVAAPFGANGDFDVDSSNNGFLEAFQTWYGNANSGILDMQFAANA
jgi:hypothetical protein